MVHGDLPMQHWFETSLTGVYWPCAGGLSAVNAIGMYAIARPDKRGTGPMAYGGLNKELDAAAELERNPLSRHHIIHSA